MTDATEQNTGTRPVAESHRFDIAALERHLALHLPGFEGPLSVSQFKGGQSNPTYLLATPGRRYVMRSKPGPVAKLLPSDGDRIPRSAILTVEGAMLFARSPHARTRAWIEATAHQANRYTSRWVWGW